MHANHPIINFDKCIKEQIYWTKHHVPSNISCLSDISTRGQWRPKLPDSKCLESCQSEWPCPWCLGYSLLTSTSSADLNFHAWTFHPFLCMSTLATIHCILQLIFWKIVWAIKLISSTLPMFLCNADFIFLIPFLSYNSLVPLSDLMVV